MHVRGTTNIITITTPVSKWSGHLGKKPVFCHRGSVWIPFWEVAASTPPLPEEKWFTVYVAYYDFVLSAGWVLLMLKQDRVSVEDLA